MNNATRPERPETVEPKKSVGLTAWILLSLAAGVIAGIACSTVVPDGSVADVCLP